MWELWTRREPYEGINYHALMHQLANSQTVVRPTIPGTPDWDGEDIPEPGPGVSR